jgi:hypothetical protein
MHSSELRCASFVFRLEEETPMPVIARFFGIIIKMYFSQREHGVPHFHAIYNEYNGVFDIQTLEMIEGDLPTRAQRLISEWAEQYQPDLLRMWNTNEFKRLPGLE